MRHFPRWIPASLVLLFVSMSLSAQTVTGTMNGTVADASGAALPGVTITIRNAETGLERVVVTDTSGFFNAPFLPIGRYNVQAQLAGMGQQTRQNVRIDLNQTAVQDFILGLALAETVTVTADAPRINVADGEVKQTMRADEIMSIPQANQTSFLGLASTMAGYQETNPVPGMDNQTLSVGSSVNFNARARAARPFRSTA